MLLVADEEAENDAEKEEDVCWMVPPASSTGQSPPFSQGSGQGAHAAAVTTRNRVPQVLRSMREALQGPH